MLELSLDGSPIHIIKIKVVQVGGRHLRVSFLLYLKKVSTAFGLAPFGETKKKHLDNMFPISYR
ncbi:hypothetical protein A6J74_29795 (plasmid) [Bacillus sp. FDAARGOS_235]|nr:hypothetical protein A6J74_29795 [Bacillus sp. FDAARGOS_235]